MEELSEVEIKEICKREPECYCPEMHLIRHEIANTPEYLRRYFQEQGKKRENK